MKRRDFLKRFGQVAAVATVAPVALSQLSKVIEPETLKTALNSPHIIKESFHVGQSEMNHIQWVKTPSGMQWYFTDEKKKQEQFDMRMEKMLFEKDRLHEFLSKHPMNGSLYS